MKIIPFLSLFLLLASCKEEDDYAFTNIPSIVASTFQTTFPDAKELEWETVNENFEAEFELSSIDHKALLNGKGELLKYKKEINFTQLPLQIQHSILENYTREEVEDIELISYNQQIYFQLEIDQEFLDKEKIYNEKGQLTNSINYWD